MAIVGAGPAGMACAHDLATYGYRPVVFEAQDRPGGMMVLGIPPYRLRRDVLQDEIRAILEMGVELRTNQHLGSDFSLASLKEDGFASVFVGVGCMRGRDLQMPGVDKDGVLRAIDFLSNANLGYRVDLGEDVLVIGGGNVALDAARTALREIAALERRGSSELTTGSEQGRSRSSRNRNPGCRPRGEADWARGASASWRSRTARRCPLTSSRSRRRRSRGSRS